jgi:tRNA dimethylallyltransferase
VVNEPTTASGSAAEEPNHPLIVLAGPTASGKSSLAIRLAEVFGGEILSCDAVAVYRYLDIGSAKPTVADRARVSHHGLDLLDPDQPTTAGDYSRYGRSVLAAVTARGRVPILVGGTGLYVRATLEGLAPSPPRNDALRERLRRLAARRAPDALHRLLHRVDPVAAARIHPNDQPKLIRSLEVAALAQQSQTAQWTAGRDQLRGYRTLKLALDPSRAALYARINERAAAMFRNGLLEETATVVARFGADARGLGSLGYAQALTVLRGTQPLEIAVAQAQAGHRQYAKRQLTWFRRDAEITWLRGFGDDPAILEKAQARVDAHLNTMTSRADASSGPPVTGDRAHAHG